MIIENKKIEVIARKNQVTKTMATYFDLLSLDVFDKRIIQRLKNRSERLNNCLTAWQWDKYEKNLLLDFISVNRCKDLFCPNCKAVNINKVINKILPAVNSILAQGYSPYMLSLTQSNCKGKDLKSEINKIYKAFYKLWVWLNRDDHKSFKDRIFKVDAAVKVLEITVQKNDYDLFHPHLHIILFIKDSLSAELSRKYIDCGQNYKTGERKYYSDIDIYLGKLWKMAFDNIPIYEFKNMSDNYWENYQCDLRPINLPDGITEIFKYTVKDSDIYNYHIFEIFYKALTNRRLLQTYGKLFKYLDISEETEDYEIESIEKYLDISESPENVIMGLRSLKDDYSDYKKINRLKSEVSLDKIIKENEVKDE
jgi:plasmid rolling circle replication initiator protein Rep